MTKKEVSVSPVLPRLGQVELGERLLDEKTTWSIERYSEHIANENCINQSKRGRIGTISPLETMSDIQLSLISSSLAPISLLLFLKHHDTRERKGGIKEWY